MNQEHTNCEDRIKFIIALMTKDYEKALDVGNRLIKRDRNDVDVTRAINILKYKRDEECKRSSLIESKRKGSDATDGDDTDFIDNADICIDPEMASKIASYDMSPLNNEAKARLDFKQKMHRVIPIMVNQNISQIKNLTRR